jgi:hypothetical protein
MESDQINASLLAMGRVYTNGKAFAHPQPQGCEFGQAALICN